MRGLKLAIKQKRIITSVASFTDAWIETTGEGVAFEKIEVASFTDAWIETARVMACFVTSLSRIFYRCVD